jgi:hypothetical protein
MNLKINFSIKKKRIKKKEKKEKKEEKEEKKKKKRRKKNIRLRNHCQFPFLRAQLRFLSREQISATVTENLP